MDDIRRPQPQRRDYALPSHRPTPPHSPHPQPHHSPHQAPHHQPQHIPHHHTPEPTYAPRPTQPNYHQPHSTHPTHQTTHHQPSYHQPAAQSQPLPTHPAGTHHRPKRLLGKKVTIASGVLLTAAAIFGAGWLLKGNDSSPDTIPTSIARQVNYTLYFPSPMPAGYTYMKDTATFQIGQVYYKFASGKKRVTVIEQPLPETKPDLSIYKGYIAFDSPIGKAVVGNNLGESQAIVVTPSTVITMNTIGGVSQDDLRTAITNLRNIGQSNQKNG